MQNNPTIALIGGTGKSGKYLTQQLLAQGYTCKMLVRDTANFTLNNPLVQVVEGDARDTTAVHALLDGCQAVLSTLGQPKGEPPIFSQATKNILAAMARHNIKRYIVTTGLSVNTPWDKKSPGVMLATEWMYNNYPATTFDKQVEYDFLNESSIDFTLIRLPLIEQTTERKQTVVSLEDCPGGSISAADLADFMIKQIFDDTYYCKCPFIANM